MCVVKLGEGGDNLLNLDYYFFPFLWGQATPVQQPRQQQQKPKPAPVQQAVHKETAHQQSASRSNSASSGMGREGPHRASVASNNSALLDLHVPPPPPPLDYEGHEQLEAHSAPVLAVAPPAFAEPTPTPKTEPKPTPTPKAQMAKPASHTTPQPRASPSVPANNDKKPKAHAAAAAAAAAKLKRANAAPPDYHAPHTRAGDSVLQKLGIKAHYSNDDGSDYPTFQSKGAAHNSFSLAAADVSWVGGKKVSWSFFGDPFLYTGGSFAGHTTAPRSVQQRSAVGRQWF